MLSRLADSLFWTGRYVERAENVARFIGVNLNLILDMPLDGQQQWKPLVVTSGDYEDFELRFGEPTRDNVIQFLMFDPDNRNSIYSSIQKARENARTMREIISSEMWEQLNSFYLMVQGAAHNPGSGVDSLNTFCRNVKILSHLFSGVTDATMSHGEAWHFFNMGRLLERADKTARILDVKYFILLPKVEDVGTPYDDILWTALLKSASASEMYRKKHSFIHPAGRPNSSCWTGNSPFGALLHYPGRGVHALHYGIGSRHLFQPGGTAIGPPAFRVGLRRHRRNGRLWAA